MAMLSRRAFLKAASAVCGCALLRGPGALGAEVEAEVDAVRRPHVCLGSRVLAESPELLPIVHDAGVTDIWQAAFLYGHW
ncbi:MAG: twin-arginine translocation signal domain-containing protein [Candidatus Hydrogenedentota bacterium]